MLYLYCILFFFNNSFDYEKIDRSKDTSFKTSQALQSLSLPSKRHSDVSVPKSIYECSPSRLLL